MNIQQQPPQKIVMTGATGLVGSALCARFIRDGHHVTILARNIDKARRLFPDAARIFLWAPGVAGEWQHAIDGCDAVVNLAGEPIFGERWTKSYKQRIYDSRIRGTREIVDAMRRAAVKPRVLVSASAVGYYGDTGDRQTPENAPPGSGFLAFVCGAWEKQAQQAEELGVRVVVLRIGVVLAAEGGALRKMQLPFRMLAGGPLGSGRQYLPWVHLDDLRRIVDHAIADPGMSGAVNAVAPQQVTNREFAAILGRALHRPSWLSTPRFVLRLALGEFGSSLVEGQRITPQKLSSVDFHFQYGDLESAIASLLPERGAPPS